MQDTNKIFNFLSSCRSALIKLFTLDPEANLDIDLSTSPHDANRILDYLVSLGAYNEEDIVQTSPIKVDDKWYVFVESDKDGNPVIVKPQEEPEAQTKKKEKTTHQKPKEVRGKQKDTAKMGRPSVITDEIARIIQNNPDISSRKLVEKIKKETGKKISPNSVWKYRKAESLSQPKPGGIPKEARPPDEGPEKESESITPRERMEKAKELIREGMTVEDAAEKVWEKPYNKLGVVISKLRKQLDILPEPETEDQPQEDTEPQPEIPTETEEAIEESQEHEDPEAYRFKSKHDIIAVLKDAGREGLTLKQIIRKVMGMSYPKGTGGYEFFRVMLYKMSQKDQVFITESGGEKRYSLQRPSSKSVGEEQDSLDVNKQEIYNLLLTGKFTVQEILQRVFGDQHAAGDPEYDFLMEVLAEFDNNGILGMEKNDTGVRQYFIEGADQP